MDKKTRIFLIRHGQPQQHEGKIFLGQYDPELSERGKDEAGRAAEKMEKMMRIFLIRHGKSKWYKGGVYLGENRVVSRKGKIRVAAAADELIECKALIKRIYSSDLLRAMQTAEIIAEKIGGVPIVPDILFREMAMGDWDGELIEDIKAKFPEEYKKRGEDLRNYRVPGGENFYDLKGRVVREFHRILREDFLDAEDDPGDLVIVAHLGVLSALNEELLRDAPGGDLYYRHFPTGSVTVYDVPEWLL